MINKRLPKKKSGRLLVMVRDHIIIETRNNGYKIRPEHVSVVGKLNQRIASALSREKKEISQLMLTDYRTVIEFRENGAKIVAKFTGTISQARLNLQIRRGVTSKDILYAHFTKDNQMFIEGMWIEMSTK